MTVESALERLHILYHKQADAAVMREDEVSFAIDIDEMKAEITRAFNQRGEIIDQLKKEKEEDRQIILALSKRICEA